MNEHINVDTISETLSDGSKAWNVMLLNEDGAVICVECVSEAAAIRMTNRLNDLFSEGGAA